MSNYTVTTNFGAKDSLASGNPAKLILGAQLTTEYNNIATAIATKWDSSTQNIVVAPAAAGTSFSVAGAASAYAAGITGNATSGSSFGLSVNAGTTSADSAFTVKNQAGTTTFFTINGVGQLTANAPTTGSTLTVSGAASAYAAAITGNSTSGSSYGLGVNAGTTSADSAFTVKNQGGTSTYFNIYGDGGVVVGAATGGDPGAGAINATAYQVNGTNILGLPVRTVSTNQSVTAADNGRGIYVGTTGLTITIPTGMPAGFSVTIINGGSTTTTIANSGTMYLAGAGSTGSRTLGSFGIATYAMAFGTNIGIISGTGLT